MKALLFAALSVSLAGSSGVESTKPLTFPTSKVAGSYGIVRQVKVEFWPLMNGAYQQTIYLRAPSRLRFRVTNAERQDHWQLELRRGVETFWSATQESVGSNFWSDVIAPGMITIAVSDAAGAAHIALETISERGAKNVPSTISHDPPQVYPILRQSRDVQLRGRAVALLEIEKVQGMLPCSGFIVAGDLLLTAAHCITTEDERRSARVIFDYDGAAARQVNSLLRVEYTSTTLDVSLCRLSKKVAGRPILKIVERQLSVGESIALIHHGDGDSKQITGPDCKVVAWMVVGGASDRTDLAHNCDTTGGSSGAPVFDGKGSVVAVHHLGWDEDNDVLVNRAVLGGEVLKAVKRKNEALFAEIAKQ
jgi:hypothetical protein